MKLLFIGGTRYVGRKMVEAAQERGHEVTLFNRGSTNADAFPGTERIIGDRTKDVSALKGRHWDAVIDVCGYWPKAVAPLCEALKENVGRYVFVSSISVYSDESPIGLTEDTGVLLRDADPEIEELKMEMYGALKVLCEETVAKHFGDRALIVRPGLVSGPGDHSDRFTYWPLRFMRPGPFLAPDCKNAPVQIIDGRDLGAFTVLATEKGLNGAYHAAGPTPAMSFGRFIEAGVNVGGGTAEPVWTPCAMLTEQGVEPWSDLPALASLTGEVSPLSMVDNSKAVTAGLALRSIEQTTLDTIDWWKRERNGSTLKWGLSVEREFALLEELKKTSALS